MCARHHPLVIGHRGAPGYRPEHSRASYELALRLGVDAVEPDLVPTSDGVLVVRHEPEIGGTTDVACHPEFASRRTTKLLDGVETTGWFTEDFTWEELSTLRTRERLPELRPVNTRFDGAQPMLRFDELLDLLERHNASVTEPVGLVAEVKHPTYFAAAGFDMARLTAEALDGRPWGCASGYPLWIECFERGVLRQLRADGVQGRMVYLLDASGAAPDDVARQGTAAPAYADSVTAAGLDELAAEFDGISPAVPLLVRATGADAGESLHVVERAHARGLQVFTWTLRPENAFLGPAFAGGGSPASWGRWRDAYRAVMDTGVDAVFADHPDLAISARELNEGD